MKDLREERIWNNEDDNDSSLISKSKQNNTKILICFLVFLLPVVLFAVGFSTFIGSACSNKVINQEQQPGGINKAVVFVRDCGATTKESYQVSIIKIWNYIGNTDTGNIFITDTPTDIEWLRNNEIEVNNGKGDFFKKETEYKEIKVTYK